MKLVSMKMKLLAAAAVLAIGTPLAFAQTPAPPAPEIGSQKQATPPAKQATPSATVQPATKQPDTAKHATPPATVQPAMKQPDTAKQDRAQTQGPGTEKSRAQAPATEQRQPAPAQTEQLAPGQPKVTGTENERRTPTAGTSDHQGPSASLTTEQRSRIRADISRQNARAVTNVNFSITVGTRIPQSVRIYAWSPVMVEYMPEYRGFMYFLVGDEIIVVDSRTHEIVAVIPA